MVNEIEHNGKKYYQCDVCKFYYETRELAQKCEDFCNKNNACSIKLTKHAVKIDDKKEDYS